MYSLKKNNKMTIACYSCVLNTKVYYFIPFTLCIFVNFQNISNFIMIVFGMVICDQQSLLLLL